MLARLLNRAENHLALLAALMVAIGTGALIAVDPRAAFTAAFAAAAAASLYTPAWLPVIALSLAGLVVLSWGFNNIPFPAGGLTIPLVDVLLIYALLATIPLWSRLAARVRLVRNLLILLVVLAAISALRLLVDVPRYGATAGRDALYVLEAWSVLVGLAAGWVLGASRIDRGLSVLWRIAVLFFLLYPIRDALSELGPLVGIQRPTPLIQFTNVGYISAVSLFWFLQEARRSSPFFAALAILTLLAAQSRGQLIGVLLTVLVAWLLHSSQSRSHTGRNMRVLGRAVCITAIAFLVLVLLPPIQGRIGETVSGSTVVAQLGTLVGQRGPATGTIEHREEAWRQVIDDVSRTPGAWLVGIGYGPDLFGGFKVEGGVDVRKPHNDFLEIWARTGILGLLPWLGLLATLLSWALRVAPRHTYGWWLIALQAATLVAALTQPAFAFAYRGMVYFLLMGLVIGATLRDHPALYGRSLHGNS